MKVLHFTQTLMKVSGILPIFGDTFLGKCMEILKLVCFLIGPIYASTTTFAFGVRHFDDLLLLTSSMYVSIGCAISISMQISLWYQSDTLQLLLKQLETLVNKS